LAEKIEELTMTANHDISRRGKCFELLRDGTPKKLRRFSVLT
jgi:hypothetical protein